MLLAVTYTMLVVALYYDLKQRRVPNWLTASTAILGLVLQLALRGRTGMLDSLAGFVLGLDILLPLFILGKFGGGDLKLLAALGLLRGGVFLWRVLLLGAISGGLLAVADLMIHRELALAAYGLVTNTYHSQRTYPYSPAIALGVLLADLGWLL
jgi:prepilin peptidase CpaA